MAGTFRRLLFGTFSSPNRLTAVDWGLLFLRLGVAALMASHGYGKLTSFAELSGKFPDPLDVGTTASLGLTVFAEFFCSIALALGLFTRLSTIPLIITMLVAAFVINADAPWGDKELAVLYLIPFLALLFSGPGRISLDKKLSRS
jgi:putative oxidoreductase